MLTCKISKHEYLIQRHTIYNHIQYYSTISDEFPRQQLSVPNIGDSQCSDVTVIHNVIAMNDHSRLNLAHSQCCK